MQILLLGLLVLVAWCGYAVSKSPDNASASAPTAAQEVVHNSAWDGSVYQVERYLKDDFLKDPDSYEGIEWSKVMPAPADIRAEMPSARYMVRHKFRAKNSFGGYVVQTYGFILDSQGNVVSAVEMK